MEAEWVFLFLMATGHVWGRDGCDACFLSRVMNRRLKGKSINKLQKCHVCSWASVFYVVCLGRAAAGATRENELHALRDVPSYQLVNQ